VNYAINFVYPRRRNPFRLPCQLKLYQPISCVTFHWHTIPDIFNSYQVQEKFYMSSLVGLVHAEVVQVMLNKKCEIENKKIIIID